MTAIRIVQAVGLVALAGVAGWFLGAWFGPWGFLVSAPLAVALGFLAARRAIPDE